MADGPIEYCDVVMKGGVTSGLVYPNAVLAISKRYVFKNIGGTSAGAIAAAATAAAALGERRRTLSGLDAAGFDGLDAVARQLRQRGFILGLFRPARGGAAMFRLLLSLAAGRGAAATASAVLRAVVTIAPLETLATAALLVALAYAVGGGAGVAGSIAPTLLCVVLVAAVAATFRVGRLLRRESLGLCPGARANASDPPALSDWLHDTLQRLSGAQDRPLLFDDLWNAPRHADEPGERTITLEVITTGVSHNEPRSLPFDGASFWFRAEEFRRLLPAAVVDWMVAADPAPIEAGGATFHRLPEKGRLPVIVAARMSLSFPLLISAVPLYEPDWSAKPAPPAGDAAEAPANPLAATEALATGGATRSETPAAFRRCWFSDGGISSNFPIHLFDAPLPRWPTFAVDLVYPKSGDAGASDVFLPSENRQGWQRRYQPISARSGIGEVASFLFAIVATMQNWRDILQSRAPGHRDRIVQVPLLAGEGGMNLDMDEDALDRVAQRGAEAGRVLVERFDFDNHWWIRWRNAASAVERYTVSLAKAVDAAPAPSYAAARSSALSGEPPPPSYRMTAEQQREAQRRLQWLVDEGLVWNDMQIDLTKGAPRPLPQLRIVPTF